MLDFVPGWVLRFAFLNGFGAILACIAVCMAVSPLFHLNEHSVVFWGLLDAFVLGASVFLILLSGVFLAENICRKQNGYNRFVLLSRYGNPYTDSYIFATLINVGFLGLGVFLGRLAFQITSDMWKGF